MKHFAGILNIQKGEGPEIISLFLVQAANYEKAEVKARKIARRVGGKVDPGQALDSNMVYFHDGASYVMIRELHEITAEEYAVIAKYLY